jgi:hypothetical protein
MLFNASFNNISAILWQLVLIGKYGVVHGSPLRHVVYLFFSLVCRYCVSYDNPKDVVRLTEEGFTHNVTISSVSYT